MANNNDQSTRGGTPEQHADAGRKGGESVSQDREHMSEIGKKGGESSHGGGSQSTSSGTSRGGTHEQHVDAGRKGGEARKSSGKDDDDQGKGGSTRGGTSEQHRKAGEQSHKKS